MRSKCLVLYIPYSSQNGRTIELVLASICVLNLQINDIQTHKRCILNTASGRKFINIYSENQGYPPFESYRCFIYIHCFKNAHACKTEIILPLILYGISPNKAGFVNVELDKYRLGLRRTLRVQPNSNSCKSTVQCSYIRHCTSFLSVTKLSVYLSESRVSKLYPLVP